MKKLYLVALMILSINAQAGIILNSGDFKFTGNTYIDTNLPNETRAIGNITSILQGGTTIWTEGTNGQYLNFIVEGVTPVVSPTAPIYNFVGTGGTVNFYIDTNPINLALDFVSNKVNILSTGNLYLATVVYDTIIGIATGTSYSANGFLNVVGGSDAAVYDTNNRPTFNQGIFADLSFGLTGSNNLNPFVNSSYQYIVSADAQGAAKQIPTPEPLALIGLGLLSLTLCKRKVTTDIL